ncbi:MAG: molybdopterin molybdenumtransferase MoeA [Nitrospirae bacterium CG_4_9_14_3_um_filter_53_35]|nr:MAG: molybdopterin molybdenumtransferase MoeA [Nitrospirae bacterium CG08_land_8_20_14_0_20_52_24]PIW86113.1 MAG: molybdopterin molybdenumtransferase MoeA [Nitrospirae bacterium CG_4_8_14_3_um_filter_50_41]PIX84766.1 MAG: molybdopterin molybdenumtransferase MoeA [Nitrospirae bacterium CG_4_10_14_3_um_filter_53_41]PJA76061.1 MAG: molybdopterin molybdenumtransferase MoeA [Nitrospirae bacterium CG_4_9_14_3_um_filter_53_35]
MTDQTGKKIKDMLGRTGVIPREEAQKIFLRNLEVSKLPDEEINVSASLGRILSAEIRSPVDLPAFAKATMDGYAVRAGDTFGATETLPAYLNLAGEVPMGVRAAVGVRPQDAVKIATGGMLPDGADAVVMLEHASPVDEKMIEVSRPAAPGENVIQAGEDIRKNRTVGKPGRRVRPQDIGALCGIGIIRIRVYRRPRVAVIPTGNEIIPPDRVPGLGQVRDINSYHLSALVAQHGGVPVHFGIVPDEEDRLKEAVLKAVQETDLILLSGGSSVGAKDLTDRVIKELGEPGVLVHGVAVKPGKPTLCALVKSRPVIGLPGHPAAVAIGFELFVRPVLRLLSGEAVPSWERFIGCTVKARITRSIASRPGREDYIRVALELHEGALRARPILGKSGLISTLVDASGTVVVPENKLGLEKDEEVDVRVF